MGIPDHLTCLLRNLYAGQKATVRTGHETTDWFQIRKGIPWGCILSLCLFSLYAEYIMRNAGLDEAQAGIKIAIWTHEVKSLSRVRLFATPWTVAYKAPLSMEFSRQDYRSGLPFPSPGDLPDPGTRVSSIAGRRFTIWATREAPNLVLSGECILLSSVSSTTKIWSEGH